MPMQPIGGPLNFDQGPLGPPLMAAPAQPKKKGGMFGSGLGVGEAIVAALNGYLAGRGNPVGMANMQMTAHMRDQKQRQALEESQYQRHREDGLQDWIAQQSWKQANTPPDVPDIAERVGYLNQLKPGLGDTYAQNYANNGGSPFGQMFTDPATGQHYSMGGPQQQNLPPIGAVMDDPRKQGGPTPPASGGFRSPGY